MVKNTTQRIMVSSAVAKIVAKDAPYADRLAAAQGELMLDGRDLVTALYLLYRSGDREIRAAAVRTLRQYPEESLAEVAALPELPSQILHFLAQVRGTEPLFFMHFFDNPTCQIETLIYLLERADRPLFSLIFDRESVWSPFPEAVNALLRNPHLSEEERLALEWEVPPLTAETIDDAEFLAAAEDENLPPDDEGEDAAEDATEEDIEPMDEENYSKYQLAIEMGVSAKIKMALTGDKEWRSIFLKDSNKLVNTAVLKNPRVTDGEVLAVAKSKTSSEELIRIILMNKEWMKLPVVRSALVSHPKTPVASALRFMPTLTTKELKDLAKSKSVSQVIVSAARRTLSEKDKKK